jgi:hypothetical protein
MIQPPAPKYTVTGKVVQANRSPFGPISVNVTGDHTQTVPADAGGNYSVPPLLPSAGASFL